MTVAVGNEFDSCHFFNPHNFTRCAHFNRTGQNGETQSLICDEPVNGRYVTVYGSDLTMCEFEAFGLPLSGMFSYHYNMDKSNIL